MPEAKRPIGEVTIKVNLNAKGGLKNIYSPTHAIDISRKDDHHAVVGFEKDRYVLDRDFDLYYTVSKDDVGLHLLAHREKGEPGTFMLLMSPRADLKKIKVETGSVRGRRRKR